MMSAELEKTGPDTVISSRDFTVTAAPVGGVDYKDASGTIQVDSEVLVRPPGSPFTREAEVSRPRPKIEQRRLSRTSCSPSRH